jgi:DNA-binding NtrC family response regulator
MVLCDGEMLAPEDFPQIRAQVEDIAVLAGPVLPDAAADAPVVTAEGRRDLEPAPPSGNVATGQSVAPTAAGTLNALDQRGNVRTLAEVEFEMIRFAIDHYNGQMSEVARRLGIGRSTLYRKLKEYGIDPDTGRALKPVA